jgi:hypothetical protein
MNKNTLKIICYLCIMVITSSCQSGNSNNATSKQDPLRLEFNVSDFDSYGVLVNNTIKATITSKTEIKPDQRLYVAITSDNNAVAHPRSESCTLTAENKSCEIFVTGITPGDARITFKSDSQTIVSNSINVTAESTSISFQGFSDTIIMPKNTVKGSLGFPKGAKIYTDYDITLSSQKQLVDITIDGENTNICKLNSKKLACAIAVTAKTVAGEDIVTAKSQYDGLKASISFSVSTVPILSIKGFEDGNIIAKQTKSGTFGFLSGTKLLNNVKIKLALSNPLITISPTEYTLTTQEPNHELKITAGDKIDKAVITVTAEGLDQTVKQDIFINLINNFDYKQLTDAEKGCFKNFDHPDNNLYITAAINNNGISVQNLYTKEGDNCIAEPKINKLGTEIAISDLFYSLSDVSNNNIIVGTSVQDDKKFSYAAFSLFDKPDTAKPVDVQYFDDHISGKKNHSVAISNNGKYMVSDMEATYQKSDQIYQAIIANDLDYENRLDPLYSMNIDFDYAHSYLTKSGFGISDDGRHFITVSEVIQKGAATTWNIYFCDLTTCRKFIDKEIEPKEVKQTFDISPSGKYIYKCKSNDKGTLPYRFISIDPDTLEENTITVLDNSKFMCSEIVKIFNNGSVLLTDISAHSQYIYTPKSNKDGTVSQVSEIIQRMNLPDVKWPNNNYNISRVSEDGKSFVLVNQDTSFDDTKSLEITVNNYSKPVWEI